ncbi:hypothetical protein Ddye_001132 [Dipteronia dyeriana]|uniref:Uncharacterized protein n=1 Tax=Dipteronia dyeriana TaxID=168575 RepID=A0AAD9XPB0_9ROSI|nr:hypothetical protein Ddye_001132 [Dipteronia dyeriana]
MSCLFDWNIDSQLSTLTVDICTTNDVMIHMIWDKLPCSSLMLGGDLFHIRCCAYILNLIVKAGLSAIEISIEVQQALLFIQSRKKQSKLMRVSSFPHATGNAEDCSMHRGLYTFLDRALHRTKISGNDRWLCRDMVFHLENNLDNA